MPIELLSEILKYGGSPALVIIFMVWWDKRRSGFPMEELKEHLDLKFKDISQRADADRTDHFDQLRRDLSTTIEKATENSIMRYLWEAERRRKGDR